MTNHRGMGDIMMSIMMTPESLGSITSINQPQHEDFKYLPRQITKADTVTDNENVKKLRGKTSYPRSKN